MPVRMPKDSDRRRAPQIRARYIAEPLLRFGSDARHVDPKAGLARYGPYSIKSSRHPRDLKVGHLGTADSIAATSEWFMDAAQGVGGDENSPEFPGFQSDRGFFCTPRMSDSWTETLTQQELRDILEPRLRKHERFERCLDLLLGHLQLLAERDDPPDYVVVSLPEDVLTKCRAVDYHDKEFGPTHRDLRRAFKAAAMKFRLPTQIVRPSTVDGTDPTPPARVAWNFFTGAYFKGGGLPWAPSSLKAGTCYVGVGFYRPRYTRSSTMQVSLVQAFDEHGEGLVLRGHEFNWDPDKEGSRSPHLSTDQSSALVTMVLDRYRAEMKQTPQRVVVHKASRFWPNEREGFVTALTNRVASFDLVALQPQTDVRLMAANQYPPMRGTAFSIGELDYLYTTGFISELQEFHGVGVPTPIQIADHVGQDTPRETLLTEILALSKMNWNSAQLGGHFPVTLRFSKLVGEILREIPDTEQPLPQFKFYI